MYKKFNYWQLKRFLGKDRYEELPLAAVEILLTFIFLVTKLA
jgi:hypothetical protein